NPDVDPDIPALLGASAALAISGMPFAGPIGAAKVGYRDGNYLLNPGVEALAESQLELVVAGTADAVLMVESEAKGLPEDVMLGAVMFGHEQMQRAINVINELAAEAGKPAWEWQAPVADSELDSLVARAAETALADAYRITDKQDRQGKVAEAKNAAIESLAADEAVRWSEDEVKTALSKLEKRIVRSRVLAGEPRIDGRDQRTVRPIQIEVGVLPRA